MAYGTRYVIRALTLVVGLILLWSLVLTGVASAHHQYPDVDTVKLLIRDRAAAHGVSAESLLCVAQRESRYYPGAIGRQGERGIAQWLPGRGNAWDYTSAWLSQRIDIVTAYELDTPHVVWYDVDMFAELFSQPVMRLIHWRSTARGC